MFFTLSTALSSLRNEPLFSQGKHAVWLKGADPNQPQDEAQDPGPACHTSGRFAAQGLGRCPLSLCDHKLQHKYSLGASCPLWAESQTEASMEPEEGRSKCQ